MSYRALCIVLVAFSISTHTDAQEKESEYFVSESCKRNSFSCTPYERVILEYQTAKNKDRLQIAESTEIEKFCDPVAEKIRVCDPLRKWRPISTEYQVDQQYADDDGFSAQISSSDGGLFHGLSADAAASAVIKMAQQNPNIRDFTLLSSEAGGTEMLPKRVLTYSAVVEDIPFAYVNTIIVGKTRNAQLITIEIGTEPSGKGRMAHSNFVDTIRLADGF